MHRPRTVRPAIGILALAVAGAAIAAAVPGALAGCGPDNVTLWVCLNPATGKLDTSIYDDSHYVDGMPDPCHCFDPCGPAPTCPVVVDAGPPGPGCDAGHGG
jgi:hypothetical protein